MKELKKGFFIFLAISLIVGSFYSIAWCQGDPIEDRLNISDLLLARPIGVAAGIIGTAIFFVSLPFTIPTGSWGKAAEMFVVEPFKFSFVREFPDENIIKPD